MKNLFVSNREIVVRSARTGMALLFKKGEPTFVHPVMHKEVMEKGIFPVDEAGVAVDPATVAAPIDTGDPRVVLPPEDGDERKELILKAIGAIFKRNDSKAFTAGGHPSRHAVGDALGWRVDQKEVTKLVEEYRERERAKAEE